MLQIWFRVYLIAARLLGIRVVWTAHNLVPHQPVFADDRNARRVLVEQSRAVIALSEASVAELASIGARDVRVIPFGAYAQRQDDTLATTGARPRLELGNGDFVAVFIGRIEPYKGVLNLIAAAQRIDVARPVRVLIGGECRDAAHRADLCAAIGNDKRCRLRLEWLSDSEVGAVGS